MLSRTALDNVKTGGRWPGEMLGERGAVFSYSLGDFLVHVETGDPDERRAIIDGDVYFGLIRGPGHLGIAVFLAGDAVFDCPFDAGILDPAERKAFSISPGNYLGIPFVVVDPDGRVAGQRYATLTPVMAERLRRLTLAQCAHPVTVSQLADAIRRARAKYPTSHDLKAAAGTFERMGARLF